MKSIYLSLALCLNLFTFGQTDNRQSQSENKKETSSEQNDAQKKSSVTITKSILSSGTTDLPLFVRKNSEISIELKDVNTFLYKVSFKEIQRDNINDEEFDGGILDFNIEPGQVAVKHLDLGDLPAINPLSNMEENSSASKITALDGKIKVLDEQINQKRNELERCLRDTSKTKDCASVISDLDSLREERVRQMADRDTEIASASRADQVVKLKERYVLQLKEYRYLVDQLNGLVNLYHDLLLLAYSNQKWSSVQSAKHELISSYLPDISLGQTMLMACKEKLNALDNLYFELQSTYAQIVGEDTSFVKVNDKVREFHSQIDHDKYGELFISIVKVSNAINSENWILRYQTTRINDKADNIAYSVKLTPVKNDYTLTSKPLEFNYVVPIQGGWKFDVSAGLMFHYGLLDDKIKLVSKSDSTVQITSENSSFPVSPSLGALLNVYWRSYRSTKLALNLGAGTNIQDMYYYGGLGVLLGRSERVGINIGAVLGKVKALSSQYEFDEIISTPDTGLDPSSLYQEDDPWKVGLYLGITYNLTGKNKDAADKLFTTGGN